MKSILPIQIMPIQALRVVRAMGNTLTAMGDRLTAMGDRLTAIIDRVAPPSTDGALPSTDGAPPSTDGSAPPSALFPTGGRVFGSVHGPVESGPGFGSIHD